MERTTAQQGNGNRHLYNRFFGNFSCGLHRNQAFRMDVRDIKDTDGSDVGCDRCCEIIAATQEDR